MQGVNAQVANRLFATFEVAGAPDFPEKHHCHKPQQVQTYPDDNCHISITNRCVLNIAIMTSALNFGSVKGAYVKGAYGDAVVF